MRLRDFQSISIQLYHFGVIVKFCRNIQLLEYVHLQILMNCIDQILDFAASPKTVYFEPDPYRFDLVVLSCHSEIPAEDCMPGTLKRV
jgi:hypothetical protein